MASTYGVPDGSALADWPIGYDEMEPFYTQAEYEIGVCGSAEPTPERPGVRGRTRWPRCPHRRPRLLAGAEAIGLTTVPVPLAINSTPYDGRPACARCRQCVGFTCPSRPRTVRTTPCSPGRPRPGTSTSCSGPARSGSSPTPLDGSPASTWSVTSAARAGAHLGGRGDVVMAAGAVESARLLLASGSEREPDGLGNTHDQVGRHLQGHLYGGAIGIFDDVVNDLVGPGPSISTHDFRHGNDGLVGGGMIANEFVPTPVSTFGYLRHAGLIGPHGLAAKQGLRHLLPRMQRVVGPVQEVTSADSPRPARPLGDRQPGHPGRPAQRPAAPQRPRGAAAAGGARRPLAPGRRRHHRHRLRLLPGQRGAEQRPTQAGTCRMGTDPATSVTDPYGRVWDHPNLRVIDGSLHVTNGGVNRFLFFGVYSNLWDSLPMKSIE